MGDSLLACDWSAHPLGHPNQWPQALLTMLGLILRSPQPMFLAWGEQLSFFYNDAYRPILAERDQPEPARAFRHVWPDIWEPLQPFIHRTLAGEAITAHNMPLTLMRDGQPAEAWHSFSYSPALGDDGEIAGILGVCFETTGQLLAEREARAATELARRRADELETVLDAVPAAIWVSQDPACETIVGNRFSQNLLRLRKPDANMSKTAPDPANVAHFEVCGGDGQPIAPQDLPVQRAAQGETITEFEEQLRFADGSTVDLLGNAVPLRDAHGAVSGSVAAFIDISARKQAERALADLNAHLELRIAEATEAREKVLAQLHEARKHETIGQLTSGVAHDFNNLLTPIMGAIEIAQRRLANDERSLRLLGGAMQAAERARTLIQRLLAFGRRQHLASQSTDLRLLVGSLVDLVKRSMGPAIRVAVDIAPGLPPAHVDPHQLEMAVLNLAVNARDAMPDGGTLTIAARLDEDAPPDGTAALCLAVSDTGTGMDEATLARALEPFFTTKQPGHGTGLGLAMVAGLAAQSGGHFSLASRPNGGTTASMWLPLSSSPPTNALAESAAAPAQTAGRGLLLLVDDEALVREGTAALLEEAGFCVAQAARGDQALSMIRAGLRPELIVTDYAMPGMTGAALAMQVPEVLAGGAAIPPVLLVTGFASLSDRDAAGLPRLAKPFAPGELVDEVVRLLARVRPG